MAGSCYVYIIAETRTVKPVKIGHAIDVQKRLGGLQTGNFRRLEIKDSLRLITVDQACALESSLHQWFKKHRLMSEWFNVHWKEASIVAKGLEAHMDATDHRTLLIERLPDLDVWGEFSPDVA